MVTNVQRDAIDSFVQFLERNNLRESARMLERESGLSFNLAHFEDLFLRGVFEAAEEYLMGFTRVHDNGFTINVVFELRWHKFLAALSDNRREEARFIICQKFQPLAIYNIYLLGFATDLVNMHNFRMHDAFKYYGHPQYHRLERLGIIRYNLFSNPLLTGKIRYPMHNWILPPQIPAALAVPANSLIPVPAPQAAPSQIVLPGPRNSTGTTYTAPGRVRIPKRRRN